VLWFACLAQLVLRNKGQNKSNRLAAARIKVPRTEAG